MTDYIDEYITLQEDHLHLPPKNIHTILPNRLYEHPDYNEIYTQLYDMWKEDYHPCRHCRQYRWDTQLTQDTQLKQKLKLPHSKQYICSDCQRGPHD